MNRKDLRLERLAESHDTNRFASGNIGLDAWLQRHALAAQYMDSARTFVVIDGDRVVGYFSLTMASVLREEAPARLVRRLPAYPVRAVLLTRLTVNGDDEGAGLGALLLTEALRKAIPAGEHAGARLVIVDAIDGQAAAFYRHHGFIPTPEQDLRLYRRMKDIRISLQTAR